MTSEAKIAANRRNAQRSTGPRTAPAKARVRKNALRHGLAAIVVGDLDTATEVERVAAAICGPEADPSGREQALIVAEAQIMLKRVRKTRTTIMEDPPSASSLDQLLRLERYEHRALSRRKRAVRARFGRELG
jgi:hypothetical protein